ncbi:hypothetical protein HALLA_21275 (plasmid) [Halostagnicola larsenii XH-48]|uniref:Uncharacterized protein n=1 Tax=Halostagnicola larsenii XH-48 TaxID=797299 RepID=W0JZ14_9EURY|nr:hypothetical protein HALLA_21275 [Halostagnicola larsenii XH-48]
MDVPFNDHISNADILSQTQTSTNLDSHRDSNDRDQVDE